MATKRTKHNKRRRVSFEVSKSKTENRDSKQKKPIGTVTSLLSDRGLMSPTENRMCTINSN